MNTAGRRSHSSVLVREPKTGSSTEPLLGLGACRFRHIGNVLDIVAEEDGHQDGRQDPEAGADRHSDSHSDGPLPSGEQVHRRADTRTQGCEGRFARIRPAGGGEDDGVLRSVRSRAQVGRDAALNPGRANAHSVERGRGIAAPTPICMSSHLVDCREVAFSARSKQSRQPLRGSCSDTLGSNDEAVVELVVGTHLEGEHVAVAHGTYALLGIGFFKA